MLCSRYEQVLHGYANQAWVLAASASLHDCHLVACTQKLAQLSVLIAQAKTGLIPHILCPHYACEALQEAVCAFCVSGCFPAGHSCTHTYTPKLPYVCGPKRH